MVNNFVFCHFLVWVFLVAEGQNTLHTGHLDPQFLQPGEPKGPNRGPKATSPP